MFIDASALCAILLGEPDARTLAEKIEASDGPLTSALAIYEAVLAVARVNDGDLADAERRVKSLLREAKIRIVSVGGVEADQALAAHDRFGKGRHSARLNMGDCFAYACARTHGVPLLFKGEDFEQTDVARA